MPQHDTGFRDVADHPQSVEQIARRVAQLLQRDAEARGFQLLDTRTVARIMAVSEDWVRAHAAELGAIRVGDGAKGTLRFELTRVRAALSRRRVELSPPSRPVRAPAGRRPSSARSGVIPDDVRDW